jgi:RimJ/RimL family protein N-acetyltransferase
MVQQKHATDQRVIFLKGRRIYLRPPTKEDIPLFLRWMNDQEVSQYLASFLPLTEADETEWIERLHKEKNEHIVLVIVHTKSDRAIGTMGLHRINWKDRTAVTGAVIGEKMFWGKGYGSEAKMFFLNYAFNSLNLRKICSTVLSFNKRSVAYSKKCGYHVEGILKKHIFKNGEYQDEIHMAVFKEDWLLLWKEFQKTGRI